ncbi:LysR family transcriptional regulator [Pseudogracilibacillus sp. SO30301A]|uniref:LysR family transcriptional regulator n=1 Tax=Pseudogracilibacillus sp. SO30301A TaxID=3098291 RepID=UPI00300E3A80
MELTELRHFIAVVNYGSFTKAATNIYVSQPTLSRSIKKLEQKLKVELFERSTRKLILTDTGLLVYEQANKILAATSELYTLLDDLMNIPSGEIKIGVPPLIGTLFFPRIAVNFDRVNPTISLKLIEHGAKKIEYLVEDGQVDVGIVVLPVNNSKFNILPFIQDEFMLFTSKKHSLANKKIVQLQDLENENFILFTREFSLHWLVINQCETVAGFNPTISYQSSQWDLITELVAAQLGITLLPKSIYSKMDKNEISMIPIESPPLWELGVITKKESYLSFAVRSLIRYLSEEFQ